MYLVFGEKMDVTAVVITGIVGAVLGIIIKQYKPEYGIFISLMTGVLILGVVVSVLQPVLETVKKLAGMVNLSDIYGEILLKALAVCYITQMASDCCKDAGESAIASKLEIAGKIAILSLSLPLFQRLVEIVSTLING